MKPFDGMKAVVRHFTQFRFTSIFWKWVNRLFVVTCCGWPSVCIRWEHLKNVTLLACTGSCFCPLVLSQVSGKSLSLYLGLDKHSVAKSGAVQTFTEREDLCIELTLSFWSVFTLLLFWMIKWVCQQHILQPEKRKPWFLEAFRCFLDFMVFLQQGKLTQTYWKIALYSFVWSGVYLYNFHAQFTFIYTHF